MEYFFVELKSADRQRKTILLREGWEVGQDFFYSMESQMVHRFLSEVVGFFLRLVFFFISFFVNSVVAIDVSL